MDPMEFIRTSRFRHHRAFVADEGWSKKEGGWVVSNDHGPEFYDIDVGIIDAYGPWRNGENRRPRDDNNGDHYNVFLEPKGKPVGNPTPTGSVPVFYDQHHVDTSSIPESVRKRFNIALATYDRVTYWWFFGFNPGPGAGPIDDHQGDWEHVTLKFVGGELVGAWFSAHGESRWHSAGTLEHHDGRVVVYVAKGSHGAYPHPGEYPLLFGVKDKTQGGGVELETWQKLAALEAQPWKNFVGAWGEVGELSHTTGPLGPWHKRHKV